VGRGVQGIRNIFGRVREARVGRLDFSFFLSKFNLIIAQRCPRLNDCWHILFFP
jgi:hypothetical protein